MDNRTGAIRALVGGRDYRDSKYNRALQAYRQVGSIFKPFVYAAAYGRGMMPGTGIDDSPLQARRNSGRSQLASGKFRSRKPRSFTGSERSDFLKEHDDDPDWRTGNA